MTMTWSNPAAVLQKSRVRVSKAACTVTSEAFAAKGLYAAGTAYILGDVVTAAGVPYICVQAGTGHAPATSPAFWMPLVALGKPTFDTKGVYAVGDVVSSAGSLYVCIVAEDGSGANAALSLPAADATHFTVLPHGGVAGLDLEGLQAVAVSVDLPAGATIGAGASLAILFIDPATGQVNPTDPADFPASLKSGLAGQALPGWRVDGPMGWMIAVPVAVGGACNIELKGSPRPALLGG